MDPLEQSRVFLDCFKVNVNPADPLPVRVPLYNLKSDEIKPAIVDWTRTYLDQFGCPQCIMTPIVWKVLRAVLGHCKETPESCGYTGRDYKSLQLNHEVISRVNQICTELLDNEKLNDLLADLLEGRAEDQPDSMVAIGRKFHFARGLKHRRRTMEDRHVCFPDFNILFNTNDTEPTAYYGVYDGHGGQEAASFAASHLHYYIAHSVHYPHDMAKAFRDGFLKLDSLFLEKCDNHHIRSGSTAVACVHRLASKQVNIAWVGDSQAILVKRTPGERVFDRLVYPTHVASDPNERARIISEGGDVIHWEGQYRVSGLLAITRAIGNPSHKPIISAEPGISLHQCTDDDLFLVMASDGLWEGSDEYTISMFILYAVRKFPDNPQKVTDYLTAFAKPRTGDNITVIIVFLKDLQTIIKETPFIDEIETRAKKRSSQNMDINGAANNGFFVENSSIPQEDHKALDDIQYFMVESELVNPKSASPLCVDPADDMGFLSDGGLGPETDVDGVQDSKQQSPSPLLDEGEKSPVVDNGETGHDFVSNLEQNTMDDYNPFGLSSDVVMESPSIVPEDNSNEIEEEVSSVSAEPVDLSEEQPAPEARHMNGTSEHHYDESAEAGEIIEAIGEANAMKADLNDDELAPLKPIDEPIVNDLLGGDSIVDNKLIDQLDSFGISEAIRRQLIEQQVTGAGMNHEQEEDEDDGQLVEEKQSEFDAGDDGAEKEDVHHEKAFDSDNVNDHHSADVKQDDDAGCCEDSEEDEWDYVKVNQQQEQQQEQQQQVEQQQTEEKPQENTQPEEIAEVANSNSFAAEELVEKQDTEHEERELEQHREREQEVAHENEQQHQQEEEVEELYPEQERGGEEPNDETAVSNTSEAPVDILGNTESTVSESTKEVDDVIIGGDAKEVFNLLNDFKEDVPRPTTTETLSDTNDVTVEDSGADLPVLSDSANMEASMYGGSVAEQQLSPDSPMSPVDNFQEQQQQQQQDHFSSEKDLFGSSMDDTMSPTGGEELNEKHLYETEEKAMMFQGGAGDLGWQLNPEAKEFVPVISPSGEPAIVSAPTRMLEHEKLRDDAIVAQSPRKGTAPSMEDLDLPAERDFQTEMDKRPHEFEAERGEVQSPLSPNPFDQLNDSNVERSDMESNGVELTNGGLFKQAETYLFSGQNVDLVQFGSSGMVTSEDAELLNKVQDLPMGEEEEQQEPLIASNYSEPVLGSMQDQEELVRDVIETETYSAKEELYVEHKETVDEPVMEASAVPAELMHTFKQLSLNGHTDVHASNPFAQSNTFEEIMSQSHVPQAVNDVFGMGQQLVDTLQAAPEELVRASGEEELKRFYQETPLEASVYNPDPSQLFTQESPVSAEPEMISPMVPLEPVSVPEVSEFSVEPPKDLMTTEAEPTVGDQPKENLDLPAENDKSTVALAATGVVAAAAGATIAAVAATVASKTAKPKAPAAASTAKKTAPSGAGTKSTTTAAKDSVVKSTTAAPRVGSNTAATAASRKAAPPTNAVKKAPTTGTAKPTAAAASTNGVKEARPASATASKPSLAAKKSATDAAKTATTTTKTTTTSSSVTAARTKAALPSTTKTASASSTTRTAAPKPASSTGTTTPVKATSRLSTTGTTTRTVTSRPSSSVSTTSVPSKPPSATTTSTVKRTVAAKTTNGTTTTDGVTKTAKTTSSTTTSSSATSRMGTTRATGTTGTTAAKPSSTLLAAKKPLDVKPAATKTAATAGGNKPSTTSRTSLAPRPTATSPAVRKVQQNGVAKKTAASPTAGTGMKKVAIPTAASKKLEKELLESITSTATTTTTTTTTVETNGGSANDEVVMAPNPSTDQLLVPVPQAM